VPTIHSRPAKKSAKRATFIARAGDRRLKILLYIKSLLLKTIEDTGSILHGTTWNIKIIAFGHVSDQPLNEYRCSSKYVALEKISCPIVR
jgi:hypothetical protein